ncbi:MAG TPA: PAS domain S-box protein [Ohtaekwangia sp.]|uniref:sensor histidine kinase n=1 Tax=Ohtaekwangia sp. TaxID=2066019 RepID=UPI002F939800
MSQKAATLNNAPDIYLERMIAEVQDYAIILLDINGTIINWNKGAEKLKGYTAQEVVGKSLHIFYPEHDRLAGLPEKLLHEAELNGRAVYEGWRVRKNRSLFWGSIVITALHDDEGRVIGFTKVTRDLTERKEAENKLAAKNAALERMNQELSSFAYASSHDLQAPLRKIRSFIGRIEETEDHLSDKSKEYIQRIITTASHMQALIDDLLMYSRTTTQELHFETTDLNKILAVVQADLEETILDKHAVIESDELPVVLAVSFQIEQLFTNLLSNALKFTRKDIPPRITIHTTVVTGDSIPGYSGDLTRTFHHLSFQDNGIGFDSEYKIKIFEAFQRLHSKQEYSGTGIGLAICKRIVENHNGIIQAEGKANEGATFHIYLPTI